jgi:hypothetical protein
MYQFRSQYENHKIVLKSSMVKETAVTKEVIPGIVVEFTNYSYSTDDKKIADMLRKCPSFKNREIFELTDSDKAAITKIAG